MEQQNTGTSVVREMRDMAESYLAPQVQTIADPFAPNGAKVAALITGREQAVRILKPEDFDPFRERPVRRRGTAVLTTADSLIEHVNRFKDADSVIFADNNRQSPSLTAVLDYHPAGADSQPRFGTHRAHFGFPLSDEWKAWDAQNAQAMSMAQFAAFLEDRVIDVLQVTSPDEELTPEQRQFISATGGSIATPSQLLMISATLKINESNAVKEARNLTTGEAEVTFESSHEATVRGDAIKVPSVFIIAIPVFKNGALYRVLARLRYRNAGGLKFWFELWRTERVFDHALTEACEKVRAETGLPLLYGRPE